MIKEINIKKFGQFQDYRWSEQIGNAHYFRRLNIIYGRNYSGKTTMSRIFHCIEKNELHRHYCNAQFQFTIEDGTIITQNDITSYKGPLKFRVYNSDFVKENLSWLHNSDGTIEPFTILGESNIELEKQIREIDDRLGSIEHKAGLLFQITQCNVVLEEKRLSWQQKSNGLDTALQSKARSIKNETTIYAEPVYNILHIRRELNEVGEKNLLTIEQKQERLKLLKEDQRQELNTLVESKPNFQLYFTQVKESVEKRISPSEPIKALLDNALLQAWASQGINLHKGLRDSCGFCGNPISKDLWQKLDAHFTKESDELKEKIHQLISTLEKSKTLLDGFVLLKANQFYSDFNTKYDSTYKRWEAEMTSYKANIDQLVMNLKNRNDDIFTSFELEAIPDNSDELQNVIKEFNSLINEQNERTKTLVADQRKAREELRLAEVAEFKTTIDYDTQLVDIENLRREADEANSKLIGVQMEAGKLAEEKRILLAQSKDESRGAELVNEYLTHFFGHEELKLVAENQNKKVRFRIMRDNDPANNLSEGECSLISFCYFIAKLQDELKANIENLVIYIDDPICSLDSNHTFFIFSLIEGIIARPKNYQQLFISTHNLDFLKYLRKLSKPKGGDKSISNFLMQKRSKNDTKLIKAPEYLDKYITEFNYLFNEIFLCALEDEQTVAEKHQYSFGNNLRKFLEAYLFFKYPSKDINITDKLRKFFSDDVAAFNVINRMMNELSHLEDCFERSVTPIDIPEIKKVASLLLTKIRVVDQDQYIALCQSVGQDATIDFHNKVRISTEAPSTGDSDGPF